MSRASSVGIAAIVGDNYRPAGNVEFYEWLGQPYKLITAEQIEKEALAFVIQGKNAYGGRSFLKVAVRSAYGGGDRMVGWVEAPGASAAANSLPTLTIRTPTPNAPSGPVSADVQMSGRFESFDRTTRMLVLKDLIGAAFEFSLRDDTMLSATTGVKRLDEYLESNLNNHPWSQGQMLSVVWKPSVDGTRRVAVSIR